MPRPVRHGTSKAVPVVVSAGLAVGVFCGLLFGVGTGQKKADAAPSAASNVKKEDDSNKNAAPEGLGASSATPTPTPTPATPTTPAAGSAAVPTVATGSAAAPTTPTTPAKPAEKMVKVVIKVVPDTAQSAAKISIDGTAITGNETDIPLSKKSVKIVIKTDGYRTAEKKLDLIDGDQMTVELPLSKRPAGGGGGGVHAPKRPDRPPSNSGGGLIDI